MSAKRLGLPNPAGRQTLGNDGGSIKRTCAAGFTLIELLVVVLIIGILADIALPHYEVAVMKSKLSAMLPLMRSIKDAEERYYLANGVYSNNIADLDVQPPAGNSLIIPSAGYVFYDNGTYLDAVGLVDEEAWYVMGGLKKDWSSGGCLMYMYFDHHKEYPGQIRCHGAGTAYARCEQACKSLGYAYY